MEDLSTISDEDWEDGVSTDEDQDEYVAPSYQDFEAALSSPAGGGGGVVKSTTKKNEKKKDKDANKNEIVRINLKSQTLTRPPTLSQKPVAPPSAVEAAQKYIPPPPSLTGPPVRTSVVGSGAPTSTKESLPSLPPPRPPTSPPVDLEKQKQKTKEKPRKELPELAASPQRRNVSSTTITSDVSAGAGSSAPRPPKTQLPVQTREETEKEKEKMKEVRKARTLQAAATLLSARGQALVKAWSYNSAGVLVSAVDPGSNLAGFIPLTELTHDHASAVLEEERRLAASTTSGTATNESTNNNNQAPSPSDPALRRAAMSVLRDQTFLVEVLSIDKEAGRVILSERCAQGVGTPRPPRRQPLSTETLLAASDMIGENVEARVRSVRPFGVFLDFYVDVDRHNTGSGSGTAKKVFAYGLVHASELSWDPSSSPLAFPSMGMDMGMHTNMDMGPYREGGNNEFFAGQQLTARIVYVDVAKARIFLSIRRVTPNPLLETLDSLLAIANTSPFPQGLPLIPSGGGTSMYGYNQGNNNNNNNDEGSGGMATVDVRPFMGDMPVAVTFASVLIEADGVLSATLGRRLQSRAFSPNVEVYMAKGEGKDEEEKSIKLVLRKGRDVQEVEVVTVLSRGALKQVASDVIDTMRD